MASQISLLRIFLDNREVFLMSQYELESNLRLQIFDIKQNETYIGHESDISLRTQAANIRVTFSDYVEKAIDALFNTTADRCNFRYSLNAKDGYFVFNWKSIDHEETIINWGHVKMNKRNAVLGFTEVFQFISEEMRSLNSKVSSLSTELAESKNNESETVRQLALAIDAKECIEKELYSKFVLVLNEKKKRIKDLQDKSRPDLKRNQPKNKKVKKSCLLNSDSSDVDDNVDLDQPGPSNATGRNSLPFLEDIKPVVDVAQNRIRNRKIPVSKKPEFKNMVTVENSYTSVPMEDQEDSDDLLQCL